ncbi:AIM24 family protein [Allobaculum stercoricanis]|uniref:AIM24 family protein n=1 Tax=Allobaculum stercoricanis TaxID=174709 RepID=UPI00248D4056|nr:AIM24 family protein [Allobaculum stercoricanis]
MYKIYNLKSNENVEVSAQAGLFTVLEVQDTPKTKLSKTNASVMDVWAENMLRHEKRQLIAQLVDSEIALGENSLSWMVGECSIIPEESSRFNLKPILNKAENSRSGLIRIKGNGTIALKPIADHLMLVNMRDWQEGLICDRDRFEASEGQIKVSCELTTSIPSTHNPNQELQYISFVGPGIVAIRIPCLSSQLVLVEIEQDELRVEGDHAMAWSKTLEFSVSEEQSDVAQAIKRVQIFKGTGKILLSLVNLIEKNTIP